ncbi:flavonol synthase [Tremella mesenterica]|uniref:Flavonol synthase n=1 Tax=Tremella mesenterica TaxID=5217 RepID=A0A4Q1BE63_TREME|nr:uncharacterized protein TREMEDRAFT_40717 [Tremella mesenterica DSM 1558]EIW66655.1 hypothetical protein TREMEDRAFT_40717 [Tremella mesenterica DSM 1558]RXK36476.1 flavonol synthase [Tremella mesenterica]
MPIAISPPSISHYSYVPETKEKLDWADLPTIDLSLYGTPEGNAQLADTLIKAVRTKGFFYVTNFGISQEKVDKQFAIGQKFYELPLEEKLKYTPDLENGEYNGYRPAGRTVHDSGVRDRTEVYNIPKFDGFHPREHPAPVADNIGEIEEFARSLHDKILDPLHTLLALALELPPDFFVNLHKYENKSEDHLRYMKYSKYPAEDIPKLGGFYSRGHTDLGTLTLLFRQPVAALQIKDHETGEWKWAKPLDGSLTVNTCDTLSFLTGGYVKSTIHRVSVPPKDQQHVDRLGLLYFARPQNDLVLNTIDSPVLKREGYTQNEFEKAGVPVPTMEEFTFKKQKWQQGTGNKGAISYKEKEGQEILPGFKGQLFT